MVLPHPYFFFLRLRSCHKFLVTKAPAVFFVSDLHSLQCAANESCRVDQNSQVLEFRLQFPLIPRWKGSERRLQRNGFAGRSPTQSESAVATWQSRESGVVSGRSTLFRLRVSYNHFIFHPTKAMSMKRHGLAYIDRFGQPVQWKIGA